MFPSLTSDGKIFAVTASNKKESSWGWYCPPNDKVNGKKMDSCLGDLFSIAWMEDADKGQFSSETITQQVSAVTARTYKSHVSTFGDSSFESEPFGNFVFSQYEPDLTVDDPVPNDGQYHDSMDVRDIPMQVAHWRAMHAEDAEKEAAWNYYHEIMNGRKADDAVFMKIIEGACSNALSLPILNECIAKMHGRDPDMESDSALQCHKVLTSTVFEACPVRTRHSPGGWNAYNMRYARHLANICGNLELLNQNVKSLEALVRNQCAFVDSEVIV